jgi:methylmalonyl-CoA mutase N-terminal domain/subunit
LNQVDLNSEYSRWKSATYGKACSRFPERREKFEGSSGIEVKPIYTPLDVERMDYLDDLGFPGEYPYTRGVQPTMYRGRLWTMRQYAGFATADESNRRYKFLLNQGQTGLSVAFDLPTQIGYDSDHELSAGEAGQRFRTQLQWRRPPPGRQQSLHAPPCAPGRSRRSGSGRFRTPT